VSDLIPWCPEAVGYETHVVVDTTLYSLDAILRTCYRYSDQLFLFLVPADDGAVAVWFRRREPDAELATLVGSFGNELVDQQLRTNLFEQTKSIREQIVAQAFGEAGFDGSGASG